MSTRDVIVVGGGPGGAAAATVLGEAGLDVLLVDKARFPRDKICGDGLTALALRMLERLEVDPLSIDNWLWVDRCLVRSPSGRTIELPLPRDDGHHAAVVPRIDLDHALLDRARKAGAEILEGIAATSAVERDDHVELGLDDASDSDSGAVAWRGAGPERTVQARWAIAADGMWSPMRKFLGAAEPGYLGEWHAFRQYFTGVSGPAAQELAVLFEADILPGYFWSFPLPHGRANVGFGIQRGSKVAVREMKALWPELLERPHIAELLGPDAQAIDSHRAWPIPARVDSLSPATRRTMFIGDAAGACDVMTGEGIGQALMSGALAAEEIIADGPTGRAAARSYAAALRAELVADHRLSALLVRALKHRKGARAAVRVAGLTSWTRRNFARWLFEDYPRAVLTTPRRWSARMLTPPGSYPR